MAAVLIPAVLIETRASPVDDMHNHPVVRQAIDDLAERESMPADDIEVLSVEAVTWPDTSMGCPHPDMRYRQIPQDGLRLTLRAKGTQYIYHSGGHRPPFLCSFKSARAGVDPGNPRPGKDEASK